jgi:hypothetical protein
MAFDLLDQVNWIEQADAYFKAIWSAIHQVAIIKTFTITYPVAI